jgi:hypothetical protein
MAVSLAAASVADGAVGVGEVVEQFGNGEQVWRRTRAPLTPPR